MSRNPYFDNAKILLILMVVIGHFISPIKSNNDLLYSVYKFIYLFHMPAFILISGYFSKGFNRPGYFKKIFKKTLIPYAFFQIIYCGFYYVTGYENDFAFTLFDPHWTLWFLVSLFFWNLLLVPFSKIKAIYTLPLAFIIGIIVGYIPYFGAYLSIERTFVFFPIFLLGYFLKKEHFLMVKETKLKWLSIPLLMIIFVGCYFIFPNSLKDWLLCSFSYAEMGFGDWTGGIIRLLFYIAMLLATISFLSLVPKRQFAFTHYGERTLYIYLLHGFFIKLIGLNNSLEQFDSLFQYTIIFILSVLLCGFLGSKPVKHVMQPLIDLQPPNFLKQYNKS